MTELPKEILTVSENEEIRSIRIVDYPVESVFRAWSEPEHLQKWWGPNGFTNTFNKFEFRVGGNWEFIMHGPEKGNYPNSCEFIRIEQPFLIAWRRFSKPLFQVVATFEPLSQNQTKIIFRQLFQSKEECLKLKPFVVDKNEENFDRLEQELEKMKNSRPL